MSFLQRMEDSLAVDVAGSYVGLRQQLCTHKVSDVKPDRLMKKSDLTPPSSGVSALSDRAVHRPPDPSFSYH